MNKKENSVTKELIIGIFVYGVLTQVILIVFSKHLVFHAVGLWIGIAMACGMTIHMKRSIEDALEHGESGALSHMRKTYIFRVLVIGLLFFAIFYFRIGSVLTAFIGVMGLKIAAYIQPIVHKILLKNERRR